MAAAVLAICFFRHFRNFNTDTLKFSFILSLIVTAMYIFNIVGVKYTTSVRASFFTTLSFLVCPVINLLVYKKKIAGFIAVSALICLAGTCMLCYTPDMGGLVINTAAQVISEGGEPIPGLYATGEVANGGFYYVEYPASGSSLSLGMTYGLKAGHEAAAYVK